MTDQPGGKTLAKILICEDEALLAEDMAETLRNQGYEVAGMVSSGEEAVRAAEETEPDLILMDIKLAGAMDGVEAAEMIRCRMDVPVVYLTAYAEKDVLERAKKTQPYGYLGKPIAFLELRSTVETALYKHDADRRIRESEELYRALVETTNTGYVIVDREGRVLDANSEYARLTGHMSVDEIRGRSVVEWTAEHDKSRNAEEVKKCFRNGFVRNLEIDYVDRSGNITPIEINATVVSLSLGTHIVTLCREITDRKKAEEELRRTEGRYRLLAENVEDVIWTADRLGHFTYVSPSVEKLTGYTSDEFMSMSWADVLTPASYRFVEQALKERLERSYYQGQPDARERSEIELRRKDGSTVPVEVIARSFYDEQNNFLGRLGVSRDISDRKQAEEQIKRSLKEKEVLLREIHHRVKNNLAVISSLINLQANFSDGKNSLELFRETQSRIRSMATAHEMLYQSENLAEISASRYIGNLVDRLKCSMPTGGVCVEITKELDDVCFGLDTAIPIGFIVTELVSNSLKHAYVGRDHGKLRVGLTAEGDGDYVLIVADNGIGLPEHVSIDNSRSLGLELVNTFVAQLRGSIATVIGPGTEIRMRFGEVGKNKTA